MAIDVTVYYGDGSVLAPDLIDPLCSSIAVARLRGEGFLAEHFGLHSVNLTVTLDISYYPGQLIEVLDGRQGITWYGKIVTVNHAISTNSETPILETQLGVEKV